MQCKQCGSEWKTNARNAGMTSCPFCGAKLEQEEENKIVFQNAKEALRYIVKSYGVDVILDGQQLKTVLAELIPDLKQERKLFMDAFEAGVCNALYLAHAQAEIDKCIAILQSIKVLTQEACIAEKWACYVVETYVYALNWNVPMFGITPNIHMYQIPESIDESGEGGKDPRLLQSGDYYVDQSASDDEMWNKASENGGNDFVAPEQNEQQEIPEQDTGDKAEKEEQPAEEEKIESPVFDFTEETEQPEQQEAQQPEINETAEEAQETESAAVDEEPEPQSPVYDFTEQTQEPAEEEKIESPVYDFSEEAEQPEQDEAQQTEEEIKPPVYDFTEEAQQPEQTAEKEEPAEAPKQPEQPAHNTSDAAVQQNMNPNQQMPWGYNPWMAQGQQMPGQQMPWGYNPWMAQGKQMPGQPGEQQMPWGYNPWMAPNQQMPGQSGEQQMPWGYNPWMAPNQQMP